MDSHMCGAGSMDGLEVERMDSPSKRWWTDAKERQTGHQDNEVQVSSLVQQRSAQRRGDDGMQFDRRIVCMVEARSTRRLAENWLGRSQGRAVEERRLRCSTRPHAFIRFPVRTTSARSTVQYTGTLRIAYEESTSLCSIYFFPPSTGLKCASNAVQISPGGSCCPFLSSRHVNSGQTHI